jgi:hypothetical protein
MTKSPSDADIPSPDTVPVGLSVDQQNSRLVSRFSLGTIFPIDIVAVESIDSLWDRHLSILMVAMCIGCSLAAGWVYFLIWYSRHRLSLST